LLKEGLLFALSFSQNMPNKSKATAPKTAAAADGDGNGRDSFSFSSSAACLHVCHRRLPRKVPIFPSSSSSFSNWQLLLKPKH
jgi:hypothetical protein